MKYLLCIVPPLAILFCGRPFMALISIPLTICFWVPGFILALIIVLEDKADKRTDRLIRSQYR